LIISNLEWCVALWNAIGSHMKNI